MWNTDWILGKYIFIVFVLKNKNCLARQATVAAQDSNKVLQKSSPKSSTKTQTQSTTDTESTTTSSSTTTTTATISPSPNQNITSSDSPENSNVSASKKMLTAFRKINHLKLD